MKNFVSNSFTRLSSLLFLLCICLSFVANNGGGYVECGRTYYSLILFDNSLSIGIRSLRYTRMAYTGPDVGDADEPYKLCFIDSSSLLSCITFQKVKYNYGYGGHGSSSVEEIVETKPESTNTTTTSTTPAALFPPNSDPDFIDVDVVDEDDDELGLPPPLPTGDDDATKHRKLPTSSRASNLQGCFAVKGVSQGFGCFSMYTRYNWPEITPLGSQLCIVSFREVGYGKSSSIASEYDDDDNFEDDLPEGNLPDDDNTRDEPHFENLHHEKKDAGGGGENEQTDDGGDVGVNLYYIRNVVACADLDEIEHKAFPYSMITRLPYQGGRRLADNNNNKNIISKTVHRKNQMSLLREANIKRKMEQQKQQKLVHKKEALIAKLGLRKMMVDDNEKKDEEKIDEAFLGEQNSVHPNTPVHLWYLCIFKYGIFFRRCIQLNSEAPQKILPKSGFSGLYFTVSNENKSQYFIKTIPTPFALQEAVQNLVEYVRASFINYTGIAGLINISGLVNLVGTDNFAV